MTREKCRRCGGTGLEFDNFSLGKHARKKRLRLNFSLREAARRIHVSAPYLCDLEYGHRPWGGKKARAYLRLLHLTIKRGTYG